MDNNIFYTGEASGGNGKGQWQFPERPGGESGEESGIDLNEQLVKNRPATFFMRVNSDAMAGAGIHCGDVVIVDRSLEPKNGKVVIAVLDGEMLIRRLDIQNNKKRLSPATKKLSSIDISESSSFVIWGVVTYVIRSY